MTMVDVMQASATIIKADKARTITPEKDSQLESLVKLATKIVSLNDSSKILYEVDVETSALYPKNKLMHFTCKIDRLSFQGIELLKLFMSFIAKPLSRKEHNDRLIMPNSPSMLDQGDAESVLKMIPDSTHRLEAGSNF